MNPYKGRSVVLTTPLTFWCRSSVLCQWLTSTLASRTSGSPTSSKRTRPNCPSASTAWTTHPTPCRASIKLYANKWCTAKSLIWIPSLAAKPLNSLPNLSPKLKLLLGPKPRKLNSTLAVGTSGQKEFNPSSIQTTNLRKREKQTALS